MYMKPFILISRLVLCLLNVLNMLNAVKDKIIFFVVFVWI